MSLIINRYLEILLKHYLNPLHPSRIRGRHTHAGRTPILKWGNFREEANVTDSYMVNQHADFAHLFYNGGFVIGEHSISSSVPQSFSLYQNFPNPFNPKTEIKYEILKSDFLVLAVYDVLGKVVATLVKERQQPGTYRVEWDGFNYPSGVYFYKLFSSSFEQTKKMLLLK
jgi:hypothetical protein